MIDEKSTSFSYTMSNKWISGWKPKCGLSKIEYAQVLAPFVPLEQSIISDITSLYQKAQAKYLDIILGKIGVGDIDYSRLKMIYGSIRIGSANAVSFEYTHQSGETMYLMTTSLQFGGRETFDIVVGSPYLTDEDRNTVCNSLINEAL